MNHYTLFRLHPPVMNLDPRRRTQRTCPGGCLRRRRRHPFSFCFVSVFLSVPFSLFSKPIYIYIYVSCMILIISFGFLFLLVTNDIRHLLRHPRRARRGAQLRLDNNTNDYNCGVHNTNTTEY